MTIQFSLTQIYLRKTNANQVKAHYKSEKKKTVRCLANKHTNSHEMEHLQIVYLGCQKKLICMTFS